MKSEKLAEWIRHPEKIGADGLREIEELVNRYPFFQTARILYLKVLYLQAGSRFRNELKAGTVHITDHKQLFRYLNNQILFDNEIVQSIHNPLTDIADKRLREINGHPEETNQGIPECSSRLNTTATQDFPYISSDDKEISHDKAEKSGQSIPDLSGISGMISEKETPSTPVLSIDLDLLEENTPISKSEEPKKESSLQTPEILSGSYQLTEKQQPISPITGQAGKEKGQTRKRKKKEELIDQFIQSDPVMPKINTSTTGLRIYLKKIPIIRKNFLVKLWLKYMYVNIYTKKQSQLI